MDVVDPCNPSPCGDNAICHKRQGVGSCSCMHNYFGNPYVNCKPECIQNSDCANNKACMNTKCFDPCLNVCGINAQCRVINHLPICSCSSGYSGDPLRSCQPITSSKINNINSLNYNTKSYS